MAMGSRRDLRVTLSLNLSGAVSQTQSTRCSTKMIWIKSLEQGFCGETCNINTQAKLSRSICSL